uniref:Prefoldin subunit 6 n=1 Tax=Geospiza parvula TaxID=87175 RepID=A0A8U8B4A1_GEOPR
MAEPLQKKLQGELEKYQQLQKELGRAVAAWQKLETQLTENNIVQEELNLLDESNTIFKLLGPVLVKQDLEEAKSTVGKRLEYITGEMKRYEQQGRELGGRSSSGSSWGTSSTSCRPSPERPKTFGDTPKNLGTPRKSWTPPIPQKSPLNSVKIPQN